MAGWAWALWGPSSYVGFVHKSLWPPAGCTQRGSPRQAPWGRDRTPQPLPGPRLSSPSLQKVATPESPHSKPHHSHPCPGHPPRPPAQGMQSGWPLASTSHFKGLLLPDILTPATEVTVHRGHSPQRRQSTEAAVHGGDSPRRRRSTEATVH